MFCTKCGKQLSEDARFCTSCGNDITGNYNSTPVPSESADTHAIPPVASPIAPPAAPSENPAKKPGNPLSKKAIIMAIVVIVLVAILGLLVANYSETKEMRDALKTNDAYAIYNIYEYAKGDEKLIGKYSDLIENKIDDIITSLNDYDFIAAAENEGGSSVDNYMNTTWGSLYSGDVSLYEICDGTTISNYSELNDLIYSKRNYCQGIMHQSEQDYISAIKHFSEVYETDSSYDDSVERLDQCVSDYITAQVNLATEYFDNDDISSGISILEALKEILEEYGLDSTEIQTLIEEKTAEYAQRYADKAASAFNEQDVNTAIGNIEVAIELQPENSDYIAQRNKYELYAPYELYYNDNVLEFESTHAYWGTVLNYDDTYTANNGSEMPHSIRWYNNSDDASASESAIYNLQGKYDTVTGTIFLLGQDKSTNFEGYFIVYGDGDEIYTSPTVTGGVLPQKIEFDVSDIQTLEIAFFGQGSGGFLGSGPSFGVSNLVAQKDFPEASE